MNAALFAALGEPSRLQIVELLRLRPRSVGGIAEELGVRQPQVSKHLRVMREAGIVAVEPAARHRIYSVQREPFEEMGDWIRSFQAQWDARLDSLGMFLSSMKVARRDEQG